MVGGPEIDHVGLEVPVRIPESTYIQPGRSVLVPVKYAQADPEKVDEWAGHGNGWVSQFLYGNGRKPKAVKVVNISDQVVRIPHNTVIACLVEKCHLPVGEGFARPRSQKYQEWGKLVYEAEPSPESLRHEDEVARLDELNGPPAVERMNYKSPEKLLLRRNSSDREPTQSGETGISPEGASAYIVCTNPRSNEHSGTHCENRNSETSVPPPPPTSDNWSVEDEPRLAEVSEDRNEFQSECKSTQLVPENGDSEPEVVSRSVMGGGESAQKAQEELGRVFPTSPVALPRGSVSQLREALARCMRLEIDFSDDEEATMYLHEGSELLSDLRNQLAALPELRDLSPKADLSTADVGVPGVTTPEMDAQIHTILERHHASFLGDGNAVPTPARGVVCDLDVGDAQPVAQRSRPIRPEHLQKVYDLLKKLLETKLVEYSDSQWASPIVIVMKKNGVDIRLCIDYRLVNQLIKLMHYPLPLIDDLLIGFESAMWFLSLDMTSGFWAVPMTLRAQYISAFICPLGHFQWTRMPFGLKNAPLIYQQMLDNCLWGFVRLPPGEEAQVDPDVLQFLGLKAEVRDSESDELPALTDALTVFRRNIPAPPQMNPVLGRSSYIDDIAYGTETWDQLCLDLDRLLYRLRYWGISVSLPKSEFGKKTISYLSHEIGAEGIRAKPKIAKGVMSLPFPSTLKGVQSFLGSLNYYNKFIEDLPVVASVLYELTDEQIRAGRHLGRAKEAFEILKQKIVSTPLLRHPDKERPFVIIVHANPWAASAVLGQEYDGVIFPVRFTGRVLHDQELRYHPAEKEVVALTRVLRLF
ncbi:hypothetical protein PR001_g28626, partial [Phytophthora rubi]